MNSSGLIYHGMEDLGDRENFLDARPEKNTGAKKTEGKGSEGTAMTGSPHRAMEIGPRLMTQI